MTNYRQHRQIAHAVGISVRITQADPFPFCKGSNPRSLRSRSHHRRQQTPCGNAIHKFEPVSHVLGNPQMVHEKLNGKIQSTGYHYLAETQTPRFFDKLVSPREYRRLDDIRKQLLGEITQPILGLALVSLEVEVVKNFSAILVRHCENRQA